MVGRQVLVRKHEWVVRVQILVASFFYFLGFSLAFSEFQLQSHIHD